MRKILIIQLLFLVFVGCKQINSRKTLVCGYAMNGIGEKMVLYMDDQPIDSTTLNDKSEFCLRLDSLSDGLYNFSIGDEYQYLYLRGGDSIALSTNMFNFDESLAFSGRGSNINNFILSMYLESEKDKKYLGNFYSLPLSDFTKKIDSLYEIRIHDLKDFKVKENNKNIWELAEISATYDLYAIKESYAKFYVNSKEKSVKRVLPDNYYSYRKNILTNSNFSYYRSFFNYAQAYINNEAYHICSKDKQHPEIGKKDFYHFHKLDLIDSIYGNDGKLKQNLYKRAVYSYFSNLSDENHIDDYISQAKKYVEEGENKAELDSLFVAAENLKERKKIPNIQLIDSHSQEKTINDVLSSNTTNIVYVVPSNNETEISSYIESRILQLKTLLPEINYIELTVGGNYEKWKNEQAHKKICFFAKNPLLATRKLLLYNPNRVIIIDKRKEIVDAFGNVFSSDLERELLKN